MIIKQKTTLGLKQTHNKTQTSYAPCTNLDITISDIISDSINVATLVTGFGRKLPQILPTGLH